MIKTYRDLRVYQLSYQLGKEVHQESLKFPKHEQYELGTQLRRATISIPLNIAEGYGKKRSTADFKRFILIAIGSCNEVSVLLDFSKDFGYLNESKYKKFFEAYDQLGRQLNALHKKWESNL